MKLNFNLSSLAKLLRYRAFIIGLIIIGVCGYTAYQISLLASIQPDQATLAAQQDKDSTIHFDTKAIQAITNQQEVPVQVSPPSGKSNPFF